MGFTPHPKTKSLYPLLTLEELRGILEVVEEWLLHYPNQSGSEWTAAKPSPIWKSPMINSNVKHVK